jgi:hypothetical protein
LQQTKRSLPFVKKTKFHFSISICSKQKNFAISVFRWQQTNESCRFPFAVGGDMKINMNMKIGMDMDEDIKMDMDDDVETWTWTWNHGRESETGKGKRKSRQFSLIRLPVAHQTNRSLSRNGSYPLTNGLSRLNGLNGLAICAQRLSSDWWYGSL